MGDNVDAMEADEGAMELPTVDFDPDLHRCLSELADFWSFAILRRRNTDGRPERIVYFVSRGLCNITEIHSRVAACISEDALPAGYVEVSVIPLDHTGSVDTVTLSLVPVLDSTSIQACEGKFSAAVFGGVSIDIQRTPPVMPHCHILDILPQPTDVHSLSYSFVSSGGGSYKSLGDSPAPLSSSAVLKANTLPTTTAAETLVDALVRAATIHGVQPRIHLIDGLESFELSYGELLGRAEEVLAGLQHFGIRPGEVALLSSTSMVDYLITLWGCILAGVIPVPFSGTQVLDREKESPGALLSMWCMLGSPRILASEPEAPRMLAILDNSEGASHSVVTIPSLRSFGSSRSYHRCGPEDMAVMLLTSGSTGTPKAVVQSHCAILSQIAGSTAVLRMTSQDITLNWLPLDHVGGLVMFHCRDVYLGCTQYHVTTADVLREPLEWVNLLSSCRVTCTWAPNFAFGLLKDSLCDVQPRSWDLSCVRYVINAGESIVVETVERFVTLLQPFGLSNTAICPAWGMSETSSAVTYALDWAVGGVQEAVSVGSPIPGIELRVVDASGEPLPQGHEGHLEVRGHPVTRGYYRNNEATSRSFTIDKWFKTGDQAVIRDQSLAITGRTNDVIVIRGANYHAQMFESVVNRVSGVITNSTAACGVRTSKGDTDELAIVFASVFRGERLRSLLHIIRKTVATSTGVRASYLIPLRPDDIPRTSIGKIQRRKLRNGFERGDFTSALKQIDLELRNSNTLPAWFFRNTWHPQRLLPQSSCPLVGALLVFAERHGFGRAFAMAHESQQLSCIMVAKGKVFERHSSSEYSISPDRKEDYEALWRALRADGIRVSSLLHLWAYDAACSPCEDADSLRRAQDVGLISIVLILQALSLDAYENFRLLVVTRFVHPIDPKDPLAVEHSPIRSLVGTVTQELPWCSFCHVDLPDCTPSEFVSILSEEMLLVTPSQEVAYRNGVRLVPALEKVMWNPPQSNPTPLNTGGFYIVTGGLGGIGEIIVTHLLTTTNAHVLVLGRTVLPPRAEWSTLRRENTHLARTLTRFIALESISSHFEYRSTDISDVEAVLDSVNELKSKWQMSVAGIIHLAAIYDDKAILDSTPAQIWSLILPKACGALALEAVIKEHPGVTVVTFSSASTFFRGSNTLAYAAANSCAEAFAARFRTSGAASSVCVGWSIWPGVGLGHDVGLMPILKRQGYEPITSSHGLLSLFAVLRLGPGNYIVGLNPESPNVRRHIYTECAGCDSLVATVTAESVPVKPIQQRDRFGTVYECGIKVRCSAYSPEIKSEMSALSSAQYGTVHSPRNNALNDCEASLLTLWSSILRTDKVRIDETFFAQGGDSFLSVQLLNGIEKLFARKLSLSQLMSASTIQRQSILLTYGESCDRYLVPLQTKGNLPPFFGVHPFFGLTYPYVDLSRALGKEQPFYGLQARGFQGETPFSSFEEMATAYILAIKEVQHNGPYFIGGWSMGGLVAFEMAQQLIRAGEDVAFLGIIDQATDSVDRFLRSSSFLTRAKGVINIMQSAFRYHHSTTASDQTALALVGSASTFVRRLLMPMIRIGLAHRRASLKYVLTQYPSKVSLFHTGDPAFSDTQSVTLGWERFANGGVDAIHIAGNHFNLSKRPQVFVLAEKLKGALLDCRQKLRSDKCQVEQESVETAI